MRLIIIFFSIIVASCASNDNHIFVSYNINKAGLNSSALNDLYNQYRQADNEEALMSIEFLLANMENKVSLTNFLKHHLDTIKNIKDVYSWDPYLSTVLIYMDSLNKIPSPKNIIKRDLHYIDTLFLDNHIKSSLRIWYSAPWSKQYTFDDFKKWVLPYKTGMEDIEDWRQFIIKEVLTRDTIHLDNVIELAGYLHNKGVNYNIGMSRYKYPLKYSELAYLQRGSCEHMADVTLKNMRAFGIPSAIDNIPVWANRNSNHTWSVTILPNNKLHHFEQFRYKVPKVYRQTYEILRNNLLYEYKDTEDIPSFFSEFNLLDVTDQYNMPLSTVKVDNLKKSDSKLVWLCTFNNHKWVPVAYAEKNWGEVTFENIARGVLPDDNLPLQYINAGNGILYLPAFYKNNGVIPASNPFIVEENGNIRQLHPDTINVQNIIISRKYPKHPHFDEYEKEMIGGRFEVANRADFSDVKTIFTIARQQRYPMEKFDIVDLSNKYRYVRYIALDSTAGNVAEIKFYSGNVVCNGFPIGVKGDTPERGPKALFDDNMESFYYSTKHNFPVWVGLDFGKRESITGLAFAARTDDNEVRLGDTYQLYYWVNGWREADKTVADSYTLRWSGIPRNTIYLLKNLSRGVEHRPFTYENGVQVWW